MFPTVLCRHVLARAVEIFPVLHLRFAVTSRRMAGQTVTHMYKCMYVIVSESMSNHTATGPSDH